MLYKYEYKLTKKRYTYAEVMRLARWCKSHRIDTSYVDIYCGTCYTTNIECMKHLIELMNNRNSPFLAVPVGYGVENIIWKLDDIK